MPRCKNCKDKFKAKHFLQKYCLEKDECIKAFLESMREKNKKDEAKVWNEQKKELKLSLKKHSEWISDLEDEINPICRLIDFECSCISCEGNGKPQAGHYHTVASDGTIRFNLHNIHLQDYHCNVEKSANIIGYDEGLIRVYGRDYWEYVKFGLKNIYHQPLKLSIPEIKLFIEKARAIKKRLEKNKIYRTPDERIKLRDQINEEIGIYRFKFVDN